jgi:D-beta-D-heptose 7-phosphate kinase/D-beta-D-heptose 1-phosphate adenosyltransferase
VSALTLALAAKADTNTAAELAAAAAAIVVGKDRTVACSSKELRELFAVDDAEASDLDQLAARVEFYRQQGNRIILTTGIFDILHPGHITFLNRAKALGDVLIVGVNSDESTRRLKGPDRPINCLQDRLQVLNALSCIDHLVAFEEDMPDEVIRAIHPDVFVKGGTYSRETLPEAALVEELGGAVQILPYLNDRSTSGIIEYIRDAFAQAVEPPTPKKVATRRKDEAAIREAYGWPRREQRGEAL